MTNKIKKDLPSQKIICDMIIVNNTKNEKEIRKKIKKI
jgi:hypothetical protein